MKSFGLIAVMAVAVMMAAPGVHAQAAASSGSSMTVQCNDGTSQTVTTTKGACRGHKGVNKSASGSSSSNSSSNSSSSSSNSSSASSKTAAAAPAASGGTTVQCNDGTSQTVTTTKGACRGHKGVNKSASGSSSSNSSSASSNTAAAAPAAASKSSTSSSSATKSASSTTPAAGGGPGMVWVNTASKTKAYHCQGDKYYGTTKQGQYMTKAQADAQGYHASKSSKACG
jgi:hypothetical protein